MPTQPTLSRMAALYERQDDPRHPMGWPHLISAGVKQRLLPGRDGLEAHDAASPTPVQAMLRGARQAAANPAWFPLTLPGTAILFGGLAPALAGAVSTAAALTWGTTGLMGAGLRAPLGAGPARPAEPARPWVGAVKACIAFGLVGACTELLALQLGRLGAQTQKSAHASAVARALGRGAECVGYGLALAVGACLTVGRLVSTSALLVMMAAVQMPAALIGGLWALGNHAWAGAQEPGPTPAAAADGRHPGLA